MKIDKAIQIEDPVIDIYNEHGKRIENKINFREHIMYSWK